MGVMGSHHKFYCVMGSHHKFYCVIIVMGPHRSGKSKFPKIMPRRVPPIHYCCSMQQ